MNHSAEAVILNKIRKLDVATYDRFVNIKGPTGIDIAEGWKIAGMLQDKPKGKIKRLGIRKSLGNDYDISKLMKTMVNTAEILPDEYGPSITIGEDDNAPTVKTEEVIIKLLRTILTLSISKNEEVYKAYYDAFQDILGIATQPEVYSTKLTSDMIIKKFEPKVESKDPLTSGIAKGILISLGEEVE